ncbi:MAG: hypothetical protein KDB86_05065 [Actinobacteria bacterium]|nr:hypothetical protein [Actinomycetota bacterium]
MKRLLLVLLAIAVTVTMAACDDSSDVATSTSSTEASPSDASSTSSNVAETSSTSSVDHASTTAASASSTSVGESTTLPGSVTTTSGGHSTSSSKPTNTSPPAEDAIVLSDRGVGIADYGASSGDVVPAVSAVLGVEPEVQEIQSCWGEMATMTWRDNFSIGFMGDEFYMWSLGDTEIEGPDGVNVGDPASDLVDALTGYTASSFVNELSGNPEMIFMKGDTEIWFRAPLSALPADDPDATLQAIEGEWGSDHDRLFTVIHDDPTLYCGD